MTYQKDSGGYHSTWPACILVANKTFKPCVTVINRVPYNLETSYLQLSITLQLAHTAFYNGCNPNRYTSNLYFLPRKEHDLLSNPDSRAITNSQELQFTSAKPILHDTTSYFELANHMDPCQSYDSM